jgi:N utilization substance protein A
LAAKLTSWRIDIKSLPEAATDALYKLQNDPEFAAMAEREAEVMVQVEAILAKKAEGRPVTPEEYQTLSQFVDRVERGLVRQRQKEKQAEEERQRVAQANVPEEAFTIPIEDLGLPIRTSSLLGGAGYTTVGDLMLQLSLDPDEVLGLAGVGAKTMQDIEEALAQFSQRVAAEEAVAEPESVEEAAEPTTVEALIGEAEAVPAEEVLPEPEVLEEPAAEVLEPEAAEIEAPPVDQVVEAPAAEAEAVEEEAAEAAIGVFEALPSTEPVEALEAAVALEGELPSEEELPTSLDELFSLRPDVLEMVEPVEEDEEDEEDASKKKKKGKKKKKFVEMEYDPDQGVVVVKKKRKRGGVGWDDNWDV